MDAIHPTSKLVGFLAWLAKKAMREMLASYEKRLSFSQRNIDAFRQILGEMKNYKDLRIVEFSAGNMYLAFSVLQSGESKVLVREITNPLPYNSHDLSDCNKVLRITGTKKVSYSSAVKRSVVYAPEFVAVNGTLDDQILFRTIWTELTITDYGDTMWGKAQSRKIAGPFNERTMGYDWSGEYAPASFLVLDECDFGSLLEGIMTTRFLGYDESSQGE